MESKPTPAELNALAVALAELLVKNSDCDIATLAHFVFMLYNALRTYSVLPLPKILPKS